MDDVKAITFDVGGTLIEPWPSVGHVYEEVASRHGVRIKPEELTRRFAVAWNRKENFSYTKADWEALVDDTFIGLTTILPSQSFFEELYSRFSEPDCWHMYGDVIPTLTTLNERGVRLAVISNWDIRLRPLLEVIGLADWFESIHVSSEIGKTKPDLGIFRAAINSIGLPSSQILHVGDSELEDYQGAQAAGMQTRWLCRNGNVSKDYTINSLVSLT